MTTRTTALAAAFVLSTAAPAAATEVNVPMLYRAESFGVSIAADPPLRIAESLAAGPASTLASAFEASQEQLDALAHWNREGRLPAKNGFSRPLLQPLELRVTAAGLENQTGVRVGGGWLGQSAGAFVWGTSVEVASSYRLRLELRDLRLPAGAKLWVWGEGDVPLQFSPVNADESGELWSPSVSGPIVHLELSWPRGARSDELVGLTVTRVLEIFKLDSKGTPVRSDSLPQTLITSCLVDAACVTDAQVPNISLMKKAVAHLQFVVGGSTFICTGDLLNNTSQDFTPYFLTANHCISSQAVAGTLEAYWDFIDNGCLGSAPSLASLPRSTGATLLATSPTSDFTLLRLNSVPTGRTFLGWTSDSAATTAGTLLPRLHHPLGLPMSYSESLSWNPPSTCTGLPTSSFLYSDPAPEVGDGVVMGGSSGSSVLLLNGQVVGQLYGWCGPNTVEPCLAAGLDNTVDGRFSTTYPSIAQYLNPGTGGGPCVPGPTTACLLSGRFKVEIEWTDFSAVTRDAFVASAGTSDTALFYWTNPNNWEVLIKAIDACSFNNKFWIYFAAATNVGYRVTVTDTVAGGAPNVYTNAVGNLAQATNDSSAFNCP